MSIEQSKRTASSAPVAPESLAAYVRRLGDWSACFCCGEAMHPSEGSEVAPRSGAGAGSEAGSMSCAHCGSSVAPVRIGSAAEKRSELWPEADSPGLRSSVSTARSNAAPASGGRSVRIVPETRVRLFG